MGDHNGHQWMGDNNRWRYDIHRYQRMGDGNRQQRMGDHNGRRYDVYEQQRMEVGIEWSELGKTTDTALVALGLPCFPSSGESLRPNS
jgi:hypothetical protein